jgi:lipid-A-disaccharide synthase
VGHPLLDGDIPQDEADKKESARPHQETIIGLLPGSREKEVIRNLPVMLSAAKTIQHELGSVRFVISQAPPVKPDLLDAILAEHGGNIDYRVAQDQVGNVFKACRLVIAVSGTVTLEAAIWGTPTVIIYKLSPISYWLGRTLVRVDHIGLVNLIAGRRVVPELIQHEANPASLSQTVLELLRNEERLENIKAGLADVRTILGKAGASKRVAEIAHSMLDPDQNQGQDP